MAHVYEGAPDGRQSTDTAMPTSRFRPTYRALTDEEKALFDRIKAKAAELEAVFNEVQPTTQIKGRSNALAMTNLEQAVMWSIHALTS